MQKFKQHKNGVYVDWISLVYEHSQKCVTAISTFEKKRWNSVLQSCSFVSKLKGSFHYIFASLLFKSKWEHLSN